MGPVVDEGKAKGATSSNNEVVPPLNLLLILKEESGVDLFSLSMTDLRARLLNGIILRDKKENTETRFFWMDEESNLNCFMLLPKSLRISADIGQVPRYLYEKENEGTGLEITFPRVKYESVRQLTVGGKFNTMGLSGRGSKYEVLLLLKLIPTGGRSILYTAMSKKLSLPDGSQTQKPWELVENISTGKYHPFHVGTFNMNTSNVGELSFDLQVYFWGRPDILIKGVAFQPSSA